MPCTTYVSLTQAKKWRARLDKELLEVIDEVEAKTGHRCYVEPHEFTTGRLWWKRKRIRYELMFDLCHKECGDMREFQCFNFGPAELDGGGSLFANRQAIAAYLYGYLNGFNARRVKV